VYCRGYSTPLQRVIVDFAADTSFDEAVKKIKEHYGINIPSSSIRVITEKHAHLIDKNLEKIQKKSHLTPDAEVIIGESDGCMIPIVRFKNDGPGDRRKFREVAWTECRLNLAYAKGSVTPKYTATLGDPDEAGRLLAYASDLVGRQEKTKLHIVGDGAPWIAEQTEIQFGDRAKFLLDFYHLSKYIHSASPCCATEDQSSWTIIQKQCMKNGDINKVIQELENHLDDENLPEDHACEARKSYNYIIKRTNQLHYKETIASDLPIGSGEIESGHRFVIQKRLKTPGGWWLRENAQAMISLRTLRSNGAYDQYWSHYQASGFA
jgi:hypothetical protein